LENVLKTKEVREWIVTRVSDRQSKDVWGRGKGKVRDAKVMELFSPVPVLDRRGSRFGRVFFEQLQWMCRLGPSGASSALA
jgi:hypothetical protein